MGLWNGVHTISPFAERYVGSKTRASSNGEVAIRTRDQQSGAYM